MEKILNAVKYQLPKFNDDLLINLRIRETEGLIGFIADRFNECIRNIDEDLKLIGWEVLSPIERIKYELRESHSPNDIEIKPDEAVLVRYDFIYAGKQLAKYLYIPYIYENSTILVGDKRCECILSVTEKIFSIRSGSNGITIKLIRLPISFWKNTLFSSQCISTGDKITGNIVSCKIHYKPLTKTKKRAKPTLIHYLLCKYTVNELLAKFGFVEDDAKFITYPDKFDDRYQYFKAQQTSADKQPMLLRVNKESMLASKMLRDIVISLLYITSGSRSVNADIITSSIPVFRMLLGKLIYKNSVNGHQALNYMNKHIESVDEYLDQYTKQILGFNGIYVNDLYDLIIYVLNNFDTIIIEHPNNNMYNKRVECINNIIIDSFVSKLYYNIYKFEKKANLKYMYDQMVKGSLKVSPKFITNTLRKSENVRFNSSVYGDNWLLTTGDRVIKRLSASQKSIIRSNGKTKKRGRNDRNSPVNIFHPSMLITESPIGFSSNPGVNALVNPYAQIDQIGGFIKSDQATVVEEMHNYIVK